MIHSVSNNRHINAHFQQQTTTFPPVSFKIFEKKLQQICSVKKPAVAISILFHPINYLPNELISFSHPLSWLATPKKTTSFIRKFFRFPKWLKANLNLIQQSVFLIQTVSYKNCMQTTAHRICKVASAVLINISCTFSTMQTIQYLNTNSFPFISAPAWESLALGGSICTLLEHGLQLISSGVALSHLLAKGHHFSNSKPKKLITKMSITSTKLVIIILVSTAFFIEGLIAPSIFVILSSLIFTIKLYKNIQQKTENY